MAGKVMRRPGLSRKLVAIHEQTAAGGHGRDRSARHHPARRSLAEPGIAGITVPFAMGFRPLFTGLGVIAGYLAALLGLSFYFRRRIGPGSGARRIGRRSSSTCSV